jgi:hypothetical protein
VHPALVRFVFTTLTDNVTGADNQQERLMRLGLDYWFCRLERDASSSVLCDYQIVLIDKLQNWLLPKIGSSLIRILRDYTPDAATAVKI